MSYRVVPFFQYDYMAFRRYGAKQLGRSFGACRSIADGNRHLKRATTVDRRIFTMPTIDNDTVLFQHHVPILTRSSCLPMPAQGRQGPHAPASDPTAHGRRYPKSENLATFPGFQVFTPWKNAPEYPSTRRLCIEINGLRGGEGGAGIQRHPMGWRKCSAMRPILQA